MIEIAVKTRKAKEVADITDEINKKLKEEKFNEGLCHLFLMHTTAALTTADLDPGTDLDMLDAWQAMIPRLTYRHPHNPGHVPDHLLSSLIGTSLTIPVKNSKLVLGTWQRVVLVEFDGPRERKIVISYLRP
jgi:secondary thiamine-phosphate synthase enzyme